MNKAERHTRMNKTGLSIGRHYSPGGKHLLGTLAEVMDEPASAMQVFAGNPQRYWPSKLEDEDEVADFIQRSAHLYKVVHAVYITNIAASPEERGHRMTIHSLVKHLYFAGRAGFDSVVFHPGSPKDNPREDAIKWTEEGLREVLIQYTGPVQLLLENAANRSKIGGNHEELATIVDNLNDPRAGICIDTTHAFAAGYTVDQIAHDVTNLRHVRLIHLNTPDAHNANGKGGVTCGSQLDRHSSTFDQGVFTMQELEMLFTACKHLPMILEGTPDLSADLAWMLTWETGQRATVNATERITLPPHQDIDPSTMA